MYWLLTRGRFPYLALLLMVTGIMAYFAIGVAVERSNASMTAEDAAMAADYAEFRKHFGNDDIPLLATLNRAEFGLERLALPESEECLLHLFDLLEAAPEQELLHKLLSRDLTRTRISFGLHAVGTAEASRLLDELDRDAERTLGKGYRLVPTGGYYQVVRDSNRLVASLEKHEAFTAEGAGKNLEIAEKVHTYLISAFSVFPL